MNTLFFIIWGLSLVTIAVFIALTAFQYVKRDKIQGKKQLRNAGISVIVMLASLAMFISTSEPSETEGTKEDETVATSTNNTEKKNSEQTEKPKETSKVVKTEVIKEEQVKEENKETVEEAKIDTSVFKYAKSIEVTDARDINNHITLQIDLNDDAQAGMGTQHVLTQMYDFLQQEDIKGADTVSYYVRIKEKKVAQFTTTVADFKADPETSMVELVLNASEVEMLNPEVEAFGKTMRLW